MTPPLDVRIEPDLEQLSRAAADLLAERIEAALAARPRCTVALSGGSTPRRLYTLLGQAPWRERIDWPKLDVFVVDERFVPPDHEESNQRMIRETLLADSPLPAGNFHPIPYVAGDPTGAARQYEDALHQIFGTGATPRFDVVLLGMGADGHTASLFPGEPTVDMGDRLAAPSVNPSAGSQRITLTLPVLNAARCVAFLVAGADKAETLRAVLRERRGNLPAARVQPVDGELIWLLDEAAAARLAAEA